MITTLLTLMLAAIATGEGGPIPVPPKDPSIRLWLSSEGDYTRGDRARVFIQSTEDGYAVVLQVDTRGRTHMLWPLDPDGDHFVRGGKKYEVKGYGGREAFIVDDSTGHGLVIVAFAHDRFLVERYASHGHWDARAFLPDSGEIDPELAVFDIIEGMKPHGDYTYDAMNYVVGGDWRPDWFLYPRPRPRHPHPVPRPWPWWLDG